MKIILTIFLSNFIFLCGHGQKRTCKSLRTGIFEIKNKVVGTTIITRNQNTQIEENKKFGETIAFDIKWIDDCTYQLRIKKIIKDNSNLGHDEGEVLTNRITAINDSSYTVRTSSNSSPVTAEWEIKIIK